MQVKSEMKYNSPTVHEAGQRRTLRSEGKKNGNAPSLDSSRPRRREEQKKKHNGKRSSNTAKRENGNVDPSTFAVGQKIESGREFRRSPLEGIKTLFQGSPRSRSNAELQDLRANQPYTRPATPGPSRKNRGKRHDIFQGSPDCKEIEHRQPSRAAPGLSNINIRDQGLTSGMNDLAQQAIPAASSEKLDPRGDDDAPKFVNQNQKKRRNRRKNKRDKSKRDLNPIEKATGQGLPVQREAPVAHQSCPPRSHVMQTSFPPMTNRPPPAPMIEFEVTSGYTSENVVSSVENLGRDMVPNIDRSPRKETVKKSLFPRAGGVVQILQNKNRGMHVGCTHTRSQQLQKSTPQVLPAANQTYRNTEMEHQNARPPPLNETGGIRAEVSKLHESEPTIVKQHRNECHGPSPGASSPPIRTRVSSQDVRNDSEAPRIRRTPRKPRRKPFQK